MRRGSSLLEILVVLVIVGLLAGMVVPGASSLADRLAVEHEAARLLVAYRSAWLTARVQHRLALLRVTSDSLAIWTVSSAGAPDTVLAWLAPGPGPGRCVDPGAVLPTLLLEAGVKAQSDPIASRSVTLSAWPLENGLCCRIGLCIDHRRRERNLEHRLTSTGFTTREPPVDTHSCQ